MSKISIEGNASGTGTLTIAAPNTNSNFTLDIPSASGVIDRLNRAGNVLQVVTATNDVNTITSSSSFVNTGLTASITPTSATSKIYVVATGGFDNAASNGQGVVTIDRNGTNLGNGASGCTFVFSPSRVIVPWAASILDSPATTSSLTYTIQIRATSGTVELPGGPQRKTITLMEIAG
jgi:hypothetical protein